METPPKSFTWLYTKNTKKIVHIQAGQCGNQIGAKVNWLQILLSLKKQKSCSHKNFGTVSSSTLGFSLLSPYCTVQLLCV